MARTETHTTPIPTQWIGPLTIHGNAINDTVRVPLATYESPLWPSTARGAKVAEHSGGVRCTIIDERMARSVLLVASDAASAYEALQAIRAREAELAAVIAQTSRFARLLALHAEIVGNDCPCRLVNGFRIKEKTVHIKNRTAFHGRPPIPRPPKQSQSNITTQRGKRQ